MLNVDIGMHTPLRRGFRARAVRDTEAQVTQLLRLSRASVLGRSGFDVQKNASDNVRCIAEQNVDCCRRFPRNDANILLQNVVQAQ